MIAICTVCNQQRQCSSTPMGYVCAEHYFNRMKLVLSKVNSTQVGKVEISEKGKRVIWRVQDVDGRGPYRPGVTDKWADKEFLPGMKPMLTFMQDFGEITFKSGFHYGCGTSSAFGLNKWFSKPEQERLKALGYMIVSMECDEVLAENENQLVFARKKPLKKHCIIYSLPLHNAVGGTA